jgi:glutathione S-transferase
MITLYHFWESGNSREVRIVLAEKGIDYESKVLNVMKGETRTPEFLAMNPFGKVPVIADGDLTLYESNIINEYLDENYPEPPLMPSAAPARARVRQTIYWANQHIHANLGPVLVETLLKPEGQRDKEMISRRTKAIEAAVVEIDRRFGAGPFLAGDFSLADAALAPHVTVLELIGIEVGGRFPRFSAWTERLKARPSYLKSAGPGAA